jgi:hypothetical protein
MVNTHARISLKTNRQLTQTLKKKHSRKQAIIQDIEALIYRI